MKHQTRQFMTRDFQNGFTIIELMLTLAIGAIILTQAIPNFGGLVKDNRLVTTTNDLVADLSIARSEAVTRGTGVILCQSDDPRLTTAGCDGSATWSTGWLIYTDDDSSGTYTSAGDTLIRIGQPVANSTITIVSDGFSELEFDSNGLTTSAGTSIIVVCDDENMENSGRRIQISTTGKPRLIKGSDSSPLATSSCTNPS